MSTPFSISGALSYPADAPLPADPIPLTASGSFDSEASAVYKFSAAGTKAVDMGTLPAAGAKGLLVKVDAQLEAVTVDLTVNGGDEPLQLSAGGMLLYFNPSPVEGITSLSLAYGGACTVRIWVLG